MKVAHHVSARKNVGLRSCLGRTQWWEGLTVLHEEKYRYRDGGRGGSGTGALLAFARTAAGPRLGAGALAGDGTGRGGGGTGGVAESSGCGRGYCGASSFLGKGSKGAI